MEERLGGSSKDILWKFTPDKKRKTPLYYWEKKPFLSGLFLTIIASIPAQKYFRRGKLIIILGIILSLINKIRARKHESVPSMDGYIPIFGHIIRLLKEKKHFVKMQMKDFLKYGKNEPLLSISFPFGQNTISTCNYDILDELYRKQFANLARGPPLFDIGKEMFGTGIFGVDAKPWKNQRKIASKIFTMRSLSDYMFESFKHTTLKLLSKLDELNNVNYNFGVFDMQQFYHRLTMDAFTKVAFSVEVGSIKAAPKEDKFAAAFDRNMTRVFHRYMTPWWKIEQFLNIGEEKQLKKDTKIIRGFVDDVIEKTRKTFNEIKLDDEENKDENSYRQTVFSKNYNLLALFLKYDPNMSDKQLQDVILNFLIAGRDTTATLMTWFTYELCINPEVEQKCLDEIKENIGLNLSDEITYKNLSNLKYLESCFHETLRKHPVVPNAPRRLLKDITLNYGSRTYNLKCGDDFVLSNYPISKMPWNFKDPNIFKPERFLHKKNPNVNKLANFNVPPRLCLGKYLALLEAKICIVQMLRKFKIKLVPNQVIEVKNTIVGSINGGLNVTLTNR